MDLQYLVLMLSYEFSIPGLLNEAFGHYTMLGRFPGAPGTSAANSLNNFNIPSQELDANQVKSHLGTPIFSPIHFDPGFYRKYNDDGRIIRVERDRMMLPATTLISLSREKILKTTPVNNGLGEVTEMYGFRSWAVQIQGICLPEPDRSVDEQIEEILTWEELTDAIQVSCPLLEVFKISSISIVRIRTGVLREKARAFSIECKSEDPTELILE